MAATPHAKILPQPRQDLPPNFQDLMAEVTRSRRMLEWDDNWDGDGSPGPDGSLDLDWQSANRELLVNIPADLNKPATFYGGDQQIVRKMSLQ